MHAKVAKIMGLIVCFCRGIVCLVTDEEGMEIVYDV